MLAQIKIMVKLELCNLYGLNVLRFSKDKKAKRKSLGLLVLWMVLIVMGMFYVGGLSYGLIYLGMQEVVPAYLITISSLLIFVFGVLKAGSAIFRKEGYDILCALPIGQGVAAASRLFRMYVEDLLMTLAVFLPGIFVYAWNIRPDTGFYFTSLMGVWGIPFIPIAASVFLGTLISGISSRMRHKSLAAAGLSIVAALGILYGWSGVLALDGSITSEMLKNLSGAVSALLEKLYPPAVWLGRAIVQGDVLRGAWYTVLFLGVFMAAGAGTILSFHKICQSLHSSFAMHHYQLGRLKAHSVAVSLCRREFKRYFSSSIYVANTLIGPVMGCVLSAALLAAGTEPIERLLPVSIDMGGLVPFVTAGVFCMMPATACSISLEGRNWWIVKSLPLTVQSILDGKILMNLLLILPFYLLSELLLIAALKPGAGELLWLILIPAVMILFSCIYGITVNLHFPVLEWESEVRVVKQSASAVLGGMGGFLLAFLCAAPIGVAPKTYDGLLKGGFCLMILLAAGYLYRRNSRFDLCGKI